MVHQAFLRRTRVDCSYFWGCLNGELGAGISACLAGFSDSQIPERIMMSETMASLKHRQVSSPRHLGLQDEDRTERVCGESNALEPVEGGGEAVMGINLCTKYKTGYGTLQSFLSAGLDHPGRWTAACSDCPPSQATALFSLPKDYPDWGCWLHTPRWWTVGGRVKTLT